jgi:putative zinc finger/helix-turn-helix YgiT family protein
MGKKTGAEVRVKKCFACGGSMHGTRTYYKYTECGLDSVTLENIIVYRCTCGAIVPEIPAIGELHRQLVFDIITKAKGLLSGQEIKFLRRMAGLSGKELASTLGASASTVSRWENGTRNISKKSDAALRLICFAGMLQEILRDKDLLPRIAEATKKLSEVNMRKILSSVGNKVSASVPVTIDPRELYVLDRTSKGSPTEVPQIQ